MAQAGGIGNTPGAQAVKGKETKGGNVSVSNRTETNITHVPDTPPPSKNDITKGKEISVDTAKAKAAAALAASKQHTMVVD